MRPVRTGAPQPDCRLHAGRLISPSKLTVRQRANLTSLTLNTHEPCLSSGLPKPALPPFCRPENPGPWMLMTSMWGRKIEDRKILDRKIGNRTSTHFAPSPFFCLQSSCLTPALRWVATQPDKHGLGVEKERRQGLRSGPTEPKHNSLRRKLMKICGDFRIGPETCPWYDKKTLSLPYHSRGTPGKRFSSRTMAVGEGENPFPPLPRPWHPAKILSLPPHRRAPR